MKKYQPNLIESKWQKKWTENELYKTDLSKNKNKYYLLVEFSYPSGDLHMGHWFTFSMGDILARFKRFQGFNILLPNGFDAFGLPAENAAIKKNIHPQDWTLSNIKQMKEQFSTMGAIFDWEKSVITCLPEYYKWNQWIFLKMYEKGLAYKGKALSNWCPSCQTVLANENVEAGLCWRCGTQVIQKEVEQWFLKITDYADKLLWDEPPQVNWPKSLREGQNNWIGKSQGTLIKFDDLEVFTTRPDTIFGATFMVINPEHPFIASLLKIKNELEEYVAQAQKKSEQERKENKEKTGVFTGSYVQNPLTKKQIPVWVADYVLAGYGTGAIMGVPAHDQRDFEFAKKYGLEIKTVIQPHSVPDGTDARRWTAFEAEKAYEGDGSLINSDSYNGLSSEEAKQKISDYLLKHQLGLYQTQYHLHDWSISRQRYWGTPIPIIYCEKCGVVPIPEKDLPVELPYKVDYAPKGKPPLATAEDWVKVKCPKCGGLGRREVETMDTFVDSSWYFFRYLDPKNSKKIFNKEVVEDWMPVDIYFGGSEHTLGHTLYSRFFTKFFYDLGLISFDEYAKRRIHHGLILGLDGARMSKSKGNVINPDEQVKNYGADAVRTYLAFLGPYDIVTPWNPDGINGVYHFLERIWGLFDKVTQSDEGPLSQKDLLAMNKTIKKVGDDIGNIKFNTAVAALMEWLNHLSRKERVSKTEYRTLALLLAPFAPHITEELWEIIRLSGLSDQLSDKSPSVISQSETGKLKTGQPESENRKQKTENWSIHQQSWPEFDSKYLEEEQVTVVIQVNGKVREQLILPTDQASEEETVKKAALKSLKVQKFLAGKEIKKFIFIPKKLLSIAF